jgi:prefoldin subunit 5
MSESEDYEEIVTSSDGVRVIKRFEAEEFPVPAIAFEFTSGRQEPVTVTLSDTVPEDIDVEDLGFHPEYGSEFWAVESDRIIFEREFDAGASYTTVYGIRAARSEGIERFLTEPTIEAVDPPLPEDSDEVVLASDDALVEDALPDDEEIGEDEEESDAPATSLELDEDAMSPPPSTVETGSGVAGELRLEGETLVGELVSELRRGDASQSDVAMLRDAMLGDEEGGGIPNQGSVAARLDQLQSDVADLRSVTARLDRIQRDITNLRAYTDALEDFLDENGAAEEIIREFDDRLDAFNDRVERLESDLATLDQRVGGIEAALADAEGIDEDLLATAETDDSDDTTAPHDDSPDEDAVQETASDAVQ